MQQPIHSSSAVGGANTCSLGHHRHLPSVCSARCGTSWTSYSTRPGLTSVRHGSFSASFMAWLMSETHQLLRLS